MTRLIIELDLDNTIRQADPTDVADLLLNDLDPNVGTVTGARWQADPVDVTARARRAIEAALTQCAIDNKAITTMLPSRQAEATYVLKGLTEAGLTIDRENP